MDPITGAALIGGGSTLLGGFADYFSDERQRRDNDTYYRMSREDQERERALQKEFAQNGVKWRMEDAERAGVHPLYALGASGASYSPTISTFAPQPVRSSAGDSIRSMGQDVSRAMFATRTQHEREVMSLQLEGMKLDNEYKRRTLPRTSQIGPSFPSSSGLNYIDGQGNSGQSMVQEIPVRISVSEPGNRAQDAGSITDYALTRTPTGMAVVPSKDAKERIEDQIVPETMWAIRNNIVPFFKGHKPPDPAHHKLPYGAYKWEWDWTAQEFRPKYPGRNMRID